MPIGDVTPEKTCAVVVGIEQYAVGAGWNLDGPASDAARFVDWLCSKGVPPGNILVLLSPLEGNRNICDQLTGRGIPTQVASHDCIMNTVANCLPNLDGELLWLFWGGHGVITSDHGRRLFCANATANNPQVFGLEDLLAMLRSKTCARFKHQIGVIDACANYFEEMRSKVSLAESGFSRGEPAGDVRQFVLYGAATGELARNDTIRKTGAFSEVVLETLERDPRWPPDIRGLRERVTDHFERLRREGKARQSPGYFQWQWPEGGGILGDLPVSGQVQTAVRELGLAVPQLRKLAKAVLNCPGFTDNQRWEALHNNLPSSLKTAFPRQAEATDWEAELIGFFASIWNDKDGMAAWLVALRSVEKNQRASQAVADKIEYLRQVNEVRRLLGDVEITTAELCQLYRRSAPDPQLAPEADDLDQVLEHLWDMVPRVNGGIAPLLEFVERVARGHKRPDLSDWVKNVAHSPQQIADLKRYLNQEAADAAVVREYLLIDLPSATSPLEYWFHSWNRERDSHDSIKPASSAEPVPAALADILDKIDSIRQGELVIELFVPFNMLCCEADRWEIEWFGGSKSTLGALHPFLLRWRDRALNTPRTRAGEWREVTRKIRARESAGTPPTIRWIDPHQKPQQVMRQIGSGDYGGCIGFLFAVDQAALRGDGLLLAALLGGAPFALWMREPPRNWQEFRQKMDIELVKADRLDDVPCRIANVRSGDDASSQPAYALTLFWDDPNRNPLAAPYPTTIPQRDAS
ncbi:MAG: hypothetical protein EA420_02410 [Candidatus Competibacteraceae bacterium]|nr:MAG: hypothetical protein EA420_02410 [Candidatus Competibacteraceae bacterium]